MLDPLTLALLALMGVLAGVINAAVGSGSLLTLPVLLSVGVPPGLAVRTNTIGLMFSSIGSTLSYRSRIRAELREMLPLAVTTVLCAMTGSILLLASPTRVLNWVVPILIVLALVLVIIQPRLTAWLKERRALRSPDAGTEAHSSLRRPGLLGAMGLASTYGGYFTAAQGILYLAVLGVFTGREMRDVNSVKVFLAMLVNLSAALVYTVAWLFFDAPVLWGAVAVLAVSAFLGGYFGGGIAKRLPEPVMRGLIIAVALVALLRQML